MEGRQGRTFSRIIALILALLASVVALCQEKPGSEGLAARLSALIESDPRPGIFLALPAGEATRLSSMLPGAVNQIEFPGEWQGPLTVIVEDDFVRNMSRTRFWMETGGERVEVHFADDPTGLASGQIVKVRGIRLGNQIAATLTSVAPRAASASNCGPIGEQKIAIIMIELPGVPFPTSVVTAAELHEIYFSTTQMSVDAYWREASYGQTSATGDVFGPFQLNQSYDFFTQQFEGLQAAINAADSTVDFTVYNHVVVIWPVPGVSGWGGRGGVGCLTLSSPSKGEFAGAEAIMGIGTRQPYQPMVGIAAHEGGHNLGLNHASSLDFAPLVLGPPGVDGVHQEYGDRFSVMGGGEGGSLLGHYNAPHKSRLGWLDPSSILNVVTDGSFVLKPLENTTSPRALRIRRGPGVDDWLWIEYRQPIGYDATLTASGSQQFSGALIHYEDPTLDPYHTLLLDFTPNTPHDFSDPALAVGQVWSDAYSPLSIRVDSSSPAGLGVSVSYRTPCTTLNPSSRNHGSGAETGSFAISAPANCGWTAISAADWITVTARFLSGSRLSRSRRPHPS
jgi:M6 family metalloprotease-like protein